MGLLADVMAADNAGVFDTDAFGETVTVRLPDGSTRSITAIVNRDVAPTGDEEALQIQEIMLVAVANDSSAGIASTEFDAGRWQIDLAYRPGETARTYLLGAPVSIDSAVMIFRVK